MARTWQYFVILAGGMAIATPVQFQLDLTSLARLQLTTSHAIARPGGNGNGGANVNSGKAGGGDKGSSGQGKTGKQDNSGSGRGKGSVGNSSNGNPGNDGGANNGASKGRENSSHGSSSGQGGDQGASRNSWKKSETKPNATGQVRRAGKKSQSIGEWKAARAEKVKRVQIEATKNAKLSSSWTPEKGKPASGAFGQARSIQGNASRSPTAINDRFVPLGSPSKPRQARNSIVVSGLSDQDLTNLAASGLQATAQTSGVITPRIARLTVPSGMSIAQARRLVRRVNLQASTDLDTYYYADEGSSACAGPGCGTSTLAGWTPPAADKCVASPRIGLIDTSIELNHDALKGQSIELLNASEKPHGNSSPDHGTAIAALLVGRAGSTAPGLIPQATLVAVDAFSKADGKADRADVPSLVRALESLADHRVKIVNLSLSGPPNDLLRKAIDAARAQGMVIVAAAGNNGAGAEPSYPAAYEGVIAVTAVDRQLKIYRRATHGQYVTFAAPGVDIETAEPTNGTATRSGTSYAVPFVSAAMAMMQANSPNTDAAELQERLQNDTRDLGVPGRDATFGYGLIQMTNLCVTPEEVPVPVAVGAPTILQESIEAP